MKYSGINVTKDMQDPFPVNHKTFLKPALHMNYILI